MPSQELMDELLSGDLLTTSQAARVIPGKRGNTVMNPASVFRWITQGCKTPDGRTVRLEAARLGSRYMTSRAALRRFMVALSEQPESTMKPLQRNESLRSSSQNALAT